MPARPAPATPPDPAAPLKVPAAANLVVVVGALSRPPVPRTLPSGDVVLELDVTTRLQGRPADTVPVTWAGPPTAAFGWEPGTEVLAVGRVRRRFFRAGGATVARTDVAAEVVVLARRKGAAAALGVAIASLGS